MLAARQMVLKVGLACGGNATGWAEELHMQAGRQCTLVITSSMATSAEQCRAVQLSADQ